MGEPIRFKEAKLEAGWLKIKPERQDLGLAMAAVRKMKPRVYAMEIKEYREKRSLSANAYAWVLIGKLAAAQGITPNEVYRYAIQNIGGNTEVMMVPSEGAEKFCKVWATNGLGWQSEVLGPSDALGYCEILCYYGSSSYDTKQMSLLIDSLIQDCKALDIETLSEEKLSAMMENWNAK